MGKELADEYGITFIETSAKTGYNVNELFEDITKTIIRTKPMTTEGK